MATATATTTTTSSRLGLALAPPPPPPSSRMLKSRPSIGKSNIAQTAASQYCPKSRDASAQLSAVGQTYGLSKRPSAKQAANSLLNEENIPKSSKSQSGQVNSDKSSERPTQTNSHLEHLQHLQQASSALANRVSSSKRPSWKSSTSALYSSTQQQQQQQQAIERRRRGAAATASLTAATSLLQLNTTTTTPNCQSTSAFRQQQQQQQQIANQRRASSLAAEISLLRSRGLGGSTQHLEALRESGSRASGTSRRTVPPSSGVANSRVVSALPQRAKSVVAINTCTAKSTTTRLAPKSSPAAAAANSPSARAAIYQQKGITQIRRGKLQSQVTQPTAAVTNSRVRQGALFARRQLHLTPVAPATAAVAAAAAAAASVPTTRTAARPVSQASSQVKSPATATSCTRTTTTKITTITCRRQLTRLTRAQPRPLAASKQAAAVASQANKLATLANSSPTTTGHSTQQRAHLLFESASRRARAGHSKHAKKLSLDSSSSSSLDAPIAHIKRPRADPQAQAAATPSAELSDNRRASLAATPTTGEDPQRRRWSSLESGSANEASSTPISCSSLSSSSSSSCLVVIAGTARACGARQPVERVHEERAGRQRRRHSSAESAAAEATTTGNRNAAATADAAASAAASAGHARRRQHVVAASLVDPQANTREQQEKVPNAYENENDDVERICDSHSTQQATLGGDYSSTILISSSSSSSSDTDKLLFLQRQQQPKPLGQALIISGLSPSSCQLTSNLDSNQQRPGAATSADVFHGNNNNDNTQCVCIVGRQPSIEDANCDANCTDCASLHSKSLKHCQLHKPIGGAEDVSAPLRVAERAFSIKNGEQNNDDENEPMILSIDEQPNYQSGKLVSPLSQLQHQQQQRQEQRRRQSQSSSPMSCDLGEQGGQDENTNLVAIPPVGANETTTTISAQEQPSKAIQSEQQLGATSERRVSCRQIEMPAPAQLKAINIEQIQNQEALAATADGAESSADELGPASKKHQPESIVAIPTSPPPLLPPVATLIKSNAKTDQISISQEPISDIYDLETRPFARGKFAQVKRCVRRDTRQCFAAKCIKKRRRLVDIKHEILLEIEALKLSYQTEYIVKLYEVYETPNEMVLILEMANGGELQRVLDDEEAIEEPLVRKMIKQILEGLVHLHDNHIAHLDIKPQNLLLTEPFPNGDVKLCDFGISRRITKDCEIRDICGTPDYVAPEILRYDPISLATDMWSLGVLTYVLLSGYSPFGSENKQQTFCNITQANLDFPIEIFGKITEDAVDFIRKLIVREPLGRLTSRQARSHHWINQ